MEVSPPLGRSGTVLAFLNSAVLILKAKSSPAT